MNLEQLELPFGESLDDYATFDPLAELDRHWIGSPIWAEMNSRFGMNVSMEKIALEMKKELYETYVARTRKRFGLDEKGETK